MPIVRRCLLALLMFTCCGALAQPSGSFPFIHYGDGDGLHQTEVYGVAQDKDGYLLIGTNKGLMRFDGATFKPIKPNGGDRADRVVDRVFHWANDSFLLVYAHSRGLGWYCNGKFSDFDIGKNIPYGINFSTSSVDRNFMFWGNARAFYLNQKGARAFDPVLEMNFEEFTTMHAFSDDSVLVSTEKKSYLVGRNVQLIPDVKQVSNVLRQKDSLLLFAEGYLYGLTKGAISSKKMLPAIEGTVVHSLVDTKGNIWFAGRNSGLFVIQRSTGKIISAAQNLGIEDKQVTHLFLDKTGNIWVSTASDGLVCVLESAYTHYRVSDGLSSNSIRIIAEGPKGVFVGTKKGLNELTADGISHQKDLQHKMKSCEETQKAFQGYIHHTLVHKDLLVVGTNGESRPAKYCPEPRIFSHPYGPSVVSGDTLIVGAWGRLLSFKLSDLPEQLNSINARVLPGFTKEHFIHRLPTGALLIGTPQGLFKTYSGLKKVKEIHHGLSVEDVVFNDVATTSEGSLWFSTSVGLVKWSVDGIWTIVEERIGLGPDYFRCLEIDAFDRIWLGSRNGIELYVDGVFSNYTTGSGLVSNAIATLYFSKKQNMLWVGTDEGITQFDLAQIGKRIDPSLPLYITDIEVIGDTTFTPETLPSLGPRQSNLRIHFGSINYANPTAVVYQYRLLPQITEWVETKVNKVEFMALASQEYRFEVRSKSSGETWGAPTFIELDIAPPFWQTIRFVLLASAVLLSLIVAAFWWRITLVKKREYKKRQLLQKINYLEQQTMSLSMNPHFIFNSLNSIQYFFSGTGNVPAIKYVSKFAKLIRLNMDSTRKRTILLSDEITRLKLYLELEKERFDKPFEYSISVSPQLEVEDPEIPNMVIQPLVENAIWHGILPSSKAGLLNIEIRRNEGMDVVITDNGVGLTAAAKNVRSGHKSLGLGLTKERLSYLSAQNYLRLDELFDTEGNVEGTRSFLHIHKK